jgi:hypothetical protein
VKRDEGRRINKFEDSLRYISSQINKRTRKGNHLSLLSLNLVLEVPASAIQQEK